MSNNISDHEKLAELCRKKACIRYQIKKIEKKSDENLKAIDVKNLQKYNKQLEKTKNQILKIRSKIRQKQVTTAYQTVVKRSKITSIAKKDLLSRNWYNTDWVGKHPELTKMSVVQQWQMDHPDGTKAECERETKMSHHTIDKWWISS